MTLTVTIDGPAGAGKSTVAALVARRLGLRHVDTGAMYRALTAVALERGVSVDDGLALAGLVGIAPPAGVDLRDERISANVSAVSRHPEVRVRMRERQRELADGAVLEGRDTGTRVCPEADVKVYLDAPVAVRAARRAAQLATATASAEEAIARRDLADARQLAPAPDAHRIDTSGLSVEQVVERVVELVEAAP